MDPLSVTASIVGLLAGAGKVAGVLHKLKNSIVDAPKSLSNLLSQINELRTCLSAVSQLLSEMDSAPSKRMSMIQVEQLVATLTDAVLTFSELEALIIPLGEPSEISVVERIKWAWKEETISSIMARLDRHKSSFTLMLNIIQCATDIQAENSRELLQDIIQQLLQSNHEILRRLHLMEVSYDSESILTTCYRNNRGIDDDDDSMTDTIGKGENIDHIQSNELFTVLRTQESQFSFEVDLGSSRVYQRTQPYTSDVSFASSAVRSHAWSVFSGLSLSQISNMSAIALPVHTNEIYNYQQYQIGIAREPSTLVERFQTHHTKTDLEYSQPLRVAIDLATPVNIRVPEIYVEGRRNFRSPNENFPSLFSDPSSPESTHFLESPVQSTPAEPWPYLVFPQKEKIELLSTDTDMKPSVDSTKFPLNPLKEVEYVDEVLAHDIPVHTAPVQRTPVHITPTHIAHNLKPDGPIVPRIPLSGKGRKSFRLAILGDCCVGKSALVVQYFHKCFISNTEPTIEDSYQQTVNIGGMSRSLHVLDSAGSEHYAVLRKIEIQDSEGFMLVYSVTDRESFRRIQSLYEQILEDKEWNGRWNAKYGLTSFSKPHPSPPILIVANKTDDVTSRVVSPEEGYAMARELNCDYREISAKKYSEVEESFEHLMKLLLKEIPMDKENQEIKPPVEQISTNTGKGKLRQRIRIRWLSN